MIAFIALGSNRAAWQSGRGLSPQDLLRQAAAEIDGLNDTDILASSGLYFSAPVGPGRQRPYVNAVMAVDTDLPPHTLLALLHDIEAHFGRQR